MLSPHRSVRVVRTAVVHPEYVNEHYTADTNEEHKKYTRYKKQVYDTVYSIVEV